MRRLMTMIGNLLSNVLALFSPLSAAEIREQYQQHYLNAMQAGRDAAAAKRQELETELIEMEQNRS